MDFKIIKILINGEMYQQKLELIFKKFKVFPSEKSFPTSDLIEYILKVGRQGELKNFCITLVGNGNGKGDKLFN